MTSVFSKPRFKLLLCLLPVRVEIQIQLWVWFCTHHREKRVPKFLIQSSKIAIAEISHTSSSDIAGLNFSLSNNECQLILPFPFQCFQLWLRLYGINGSTTCDIGAIPVWAIQKWFFAFRSDNGNFEWQWQLLRRWKASKHRLVKLHVRVYMA